MQSRTSSHGSHRRLWVAFSGVVAGAAALVVFGAADQGAERQRALRATPQVPESVTLATVAPSASRAAAVTDAAVQSHQIPPAKAVPAAAPSGAAGVIAAIDPATGQLRAPTPEEVRALTESAQPEARAAFEAAPRVLTSRYGGQGVKLGPEHMTSLVATRGPDGKLTFRHASGANPDLTSSTPGAKGQAGQEVRDDR